MKGEVEVSKKSKGRLTIECDELWSYIGNKDNKQWIGLVGVAIGDRSRVTAQQLWNSLPGIYRQCAVSYINFWEAYSMIFPGRRHQAVGKETGETNHIERINCTFTGFIGWEDS